MGGRNGFLAATQRRVLLDDERGTARVMPSARLDPCVCDGGGSADINEVDGMEAAAIADVLCRGSDSANGTADPDTALPFDELSSSCVGGCDVGADMGCGSRDWV